MIKKYNRITKIHPDQDLIDGIREYSQLGLYPRDISKKLDYHEKWLPNILSLLNKKNPKKEDVAKFKPYYDAFVKGKKYSAKKLFTKAVDVAETTNNSTTLLNASRMQLEATEKYEREENKHDSQALLRGARNAIRSKIVTPYHVLFEETIEHAIFKGGRGSGKTLNAGVLYQLWLFLHPDYYGKVFANVREKCNSIKASTYSVLKSVIETLELTDIIHIAATEITCPINKTSIQFFGVAQDDSFKGISNVSFIFFEEGSYLEAQELDKFVLSMREDNMKGGHKAVIRTVLCYNPVTNYDSALEWYENKKVGDNSDGVLIAHVNMEDLPKRYQSATLKASFKQLKEVDYERYKHVALGAPVPNLGEYPFDVLVSSDDLPKPLKKHHVVAYLDPAKGGGDKTALAIAYVNNDGNLIVTGKSWKSAFWSDRVIIDIINMINEYNVNEFWAEENILTNPFEEILRSADIDNGSFIDKEEKELYNDNWSRLFKVKSNVRFNQEFQGRNKYERIINVAARKPIMEKIIIEKNAQSLDFHNEIIKFNAYECERGGHKENYTDDAVDALVGCINKLGLMDFDDVIIHELNGDNDVRLV